MNTFDWKNIELGIAVDGLRNVFVKRICSPYRKYKSFLFKSQYWTREQLSEYQNMKLQQLFKHAYKHIPYYRGLMQVYGFEPSDFRTLDDLAKMPFTTKRKVSDNLPDFISEAALQSVLYRCKTSGTMGAPLVLYRDLYNVGFEHAVLMRQMRWAGLKTSDRFASLKGDTIAARKVRKGMFWSASFAENKLAMNTLFLNENNVRNYVQAIQKFGAKFIDGYPSLIYRLAVFMQEKSIHLPLRAVLTTAEPMETQQRFVIENAFLCRVYDYYGLAERVAAIHTCDRGRYHIIPEYSAVELVENKALPEGYFEIVGSSFCNSAMPLIRYRTGDAVQASLESCPCGRAYPVVKSIVGRLHEYIVTPSGKLIWMWDRIFKGSSNLIQAQLYQPDLNHVVVRVVPKKSYQKIDGQKIIEKLQAGINEKMDFAVECIPVLPRNGNGKFRAVISKVHSTGNLNYVV